MKLLSFDALQFDYHNIISVCNFINRVGKNSKRIRYWSSYVTYRSTNRRLLIEMNGPEYRSGMQLFLKIVHD